MYDWLISSEPFPSLEVRLLFQFLNDGLWFTKIQMNALGLSRDHISVHLLGVPPFFLR